MACDSHPAPLETHLGYWLRLVSNHVSRAFALKVAARGVTVAEWVMLRELYEVDAIAPSGIAAALGLTRGAISKLVDRLEAKRLILRAHDADDRRFQSIALTKVGRALVPELAALADANDAEFFGHLRRDERERAEALLRAIARRGGMTGAPTD